jgi:hypothetical protein
MDLCPHAHRNSGPHLSLTAREAGRVDEPIR